MRRKKKVLLYLLAVIAVPVAGLYIFLAISNNPLQFWRKDNRAQAKIDGKPTNVAVYRRPSAKMLIDLGKTMDRPYVYFPEVNNVGLCGSIRGFSIPGYIYAKNFDDEFCDCVLMGTAKTEVDAQVGVKDNRLEFTTIEGKRVEISW